MSVFSLAGFSPGWGIELCDLRDPFQLKCVTIPSNWSHLVMGCYSVIFAGLSPLMHEVMISLKMCIRQRIVPFIQWQTAWKFINSFHAVAHLVSLHFIWYLSSVLCFHYNKLGIEPRSWDLALTCYITPLTILLFCYLIDFSFLLFAYIFILQ